MRAAPAHSLESPQQKHASTGLPRILARSHAAPNGLRFDDTAVIGAAVSLAVPEGLVLSTHYTFEETAPVSGSAYRSSHLERQRPTDAWPPVLFALRPGCSTSMAVSGSRWLA